MDTSKLELICLRKKVQQNGQYQQFAQNNSYGRERGIVMAVLFNKEQNKYLELNLSMTNEFDWVGYSMCGGNIYQQKRIELFRLDNGDLFLHNAAYENEIENIIDGLRNIKELHHYTFEPVDEGEFRLESDYKDNIVYIKCIFYVIDIMENEGIKDNIFEIETTYVMLYEFLTQLRKDYNMVK